MTHRKVIRLNGKLTEIPQTSFTPIAASQKKQKHSFAKTNSEEKDQNSPRAWKSGISQ